jgi:hypothetical protein
MNNEREIKQVFLRENILDKDYDIDEFLKYILSIKGEDGADVDLWTFAEIKQAVFNFIASKEKLNDIAANNKED